jgi:hypothetical protein
MSRRRRELNQEAKERWPTLYQFIGGYLHEDWPEMYGTPADAVGVAISEYPLELQQQVLREWRDWNSSVGAVDDIRSLLGDGLGACVHFKTQLEARHFMNSVYDRLIESVRRQYDKDWKP